VTQVTQLPDVSRLNGEHLPLIMMSNEHLLRRESPEQGRIWGMTPEESLAGGVIAVTYDTAV